MQDAALRAAPRQAERLQQRGQNGQRPEDRFTPVSLQQLLCDEPLKERDWHQSVDQHHDCGGRREDQEHGEIAGELLRQAVARGEAQPARHGEIRSGAAWYDGFTTALTRLRGPGKLLNDPAELARVLKVYEGIKSDFGNVSIADLIVLGGNVGVEQAAKAAGHSVTVPFTSGRGDASQEQTDAHSFEPLEPKAEGFRNYLSVRFSVPTEELLVDRAQLLGLSAPETEYASPGGDVLVLRGTWDALDRRVAHPGLLAVDPPAQLRRHAV